MTKNPFHFCHRCLQEGSIPYKTKNGASVVVCQGCVSTRDHAGLRDQQFREIRHYRNEVYEP